MAFILLKRSRNTRNYYLVENFRDDDGATRRRTLCYLGREQDGTDTIAGAIGHWKRVREQAALEFRTTKGARKDVLRKRRDKADERIALLNPYLKKAEAVEVKRQERARQAEETTLWQSFEQLRRHPNEANAQAAKRAYLALAKRHHPDQGGNHRDFLKLKDAYDRARAAWRRIAA
jgi:hypothetical protein